MDAYERNNFLSMYNNYAVETRYEECVFVKACLFILEVDIKLLNTYNISMGLLSNERYNCDVESILRG